jgi:uncharacterized phage protein (TIGR01671 family)
MKREILFRGKSKVHGNWEYGDLINSRGEYFIGNTVANDPENWSYTIPETVGQFTGLTDKNGVKIFEGDIVKTETDKPMKVSWNTRFASYCLNRKGWAFSHFFGEACDPDQVEVIGNMHDNPELIGKEVLNVG